MPFFSLLIKKQCMSCKSVLLLFTIPNFISIPSNGSRILGIVPIPSYSHQIVYHPLWKELSLRGHQLTVLTTDPINDPSLTNLTEIDLHFTYETWNKNFLCTINGKGLLKTFDVFVSVLHDIMAQELEDSEVQKLIKNESEHFDLLIIELMYPTMLAFAERFNCPFIGMSSIDFPTVVYKKVGNPTHPVLYPDPVLPFSGKLSFIERFLSSIFPIFTKLYYHTYTIPTEDATIKKYFNDNYPYLLDISNNISLLFANTNPIFHPGRPLVPVVKQIGAGIHIKPPQQLPKDLQILLDSAKKGFLYFSLGTNVKSKDLSNQTRNVILDTFTELPYTILWKFEMEDLPGKPDNVHAAKWFPQQDVFRHSNIKLFITQGGSQSTEEAIFCHIPMVGMPFFGDQTSNIKRLVHKGVGLALDQNTLTKQKFKETILEVINNPKYRDRVKELNKLVRDEPMTGLERAVWWTEYLLRHKTVDHLKSPAVDLPFYQHAMLDVIGFFLIILVVLMYLIVY